MEVIDVKREYLVIAVEVDVINFSVPGSPRWIPGEKWVTLLDVLDGSRHRLRATSEVGEIRLLDAEVSGWRPL